ncbi:MAG: YjjG family noncanonical pyrimidine nucleotidase [Mangrovibacterium sp.]
MPIIRKYDHLFFDLDNTLWDFDVNARLALQQAIADIGLRSQVPDFNSFFSFFEKTNTNLWEAYRKQEIRQSELVLKRFEIIIDHFGLTGISPETINNRYLHLMPEYNRLVEGAIETLDYLKGEGYHLHIITNGLSAVQNEKVKKSGLAPYFKKVFASEDINAPKPDKRIFRYALMSCNAKKSRSMIIGDSWETDIAGAREMSIDHVLFIKNEKKAIIPPEIQKDTAKNIHLSVSTPRKNYYTIKNLMQLKEIL